MWILELQGKHSEWQIDMFQRFRILYWYHRMLFIGVTGEGVSVVSLVFVNRKTNELRLNEKQLKKK